MRFIIKPVLSAQVDPNNGIRTSVQYIDIGNK